MNMEPSDSYLVVAHMIREGDLTALELANLLSTLESQGMISVSEQAALLELAVDATLEELASP